MEEAEHPIYPPMMANETPLIPRRPFQAACAPSLPDRGMPRVPGSEPRASFHPILFAGGLLLVVLISLLDYETGPHLRHSILYLVPVAACAWWGGFSYGILLGLSCSVAWHVVDQLEFPMASAAAGVWNGVVRFGTLALVSSLVSRLHVA